MNREKLYQIWKHEEDIAHIHGWDFSHIHGRYDEERDLPWDYDTVVKKYLDPTKKLMDFDMDMMTILLIVLPMYPRLVEGFIYSVNLLEYSDATAFNRTMYFVLFISLMLIGIIMTVSTILGKSRIQSILAKVSIIESVITILFTILARDPYPAALAFILLMIKLVIIWYRFGIAKT